MAVDDPIAWFDSLPDEIVSLWDAYYRLEPFGGEYHRHAAEMELLEHIYARLHNRDVPSGRNDLVYKPRKRSDFMPVDYAGEHKKRSVSNKDILQQCEMLAKSIAKNRDKIRGNHNQ